MNQKQGIETTLSALTERLSTALGEQLVSVVLYGSAAMGDWQEHHSDINVLCVLRRLHSQELAACEPIFRWWTAGGNLPPLLLTAEEVRTSTDCFPMEFRDMRDHRRILFGSDPIDGLQIDWSFYRAQVEHELRAKQIRLRQKAAGLLRAPEKLKGLLVDSLSTFSVLGRHALILSGRPPLYKKAEVLSALEDALARKLDGSRQILSFRLSSQQTAGRDVTIAFEKYLDEMEALVQFVDALEK